MRSPSAETLAFVIEVTSVIGSALVDDTRRRESDVAISGRSLGRFSSSLGATRSLVTTVGSEEVGASGTRGAGLKKSLATLGGALDKFRVAFVSEDGDGDGEGDGEGCGVPAPPASLPVTLGLSEPVSPLKSFALKVIAKPKRAVQRFTGSSCPKFAGTVLPLLKPTGK